MSTSDWESIRDPIVNILREAPRFVSGSGKGRETCFLTAYQIAVLLNKRHKPQLQRLKIPKNIGGLGEGVHTSLSQYIANALSRDTQPGGALCGVVAMEFFCTEGMEQFSFLDERGILSQPSNQCFSMFRYVGTNTEQ